MNELIYGLNDILDTKTVCSIYECTAINNVILYLFLKTLCFMHKCLRMRCLFDFDKNLSTAVTYK